MKMIQKVIRVPVDEAEKTINKLIEEGWKVLIATPILDYHSSSIIDCAYAGTYTDSIQYVIEKPDMTSDFLEEKGKLALIHELREKTGAGLTDCKGALIATGYKSIEDAIQWLREHP